MKQKLLSISKNTTKHFLKLFPTDTIDTNITIYNVFDYAWDGWKQYIKKTIFPTTHTLLLGINPGPHGMLQTGVPFGNISTVRDYIAISPTIHLPKTTISQRPIKGMNYTREEPSGVLLWKIISSLFPHAKHFFSRHCVLNYCPLAFFSPSGENITPDKLPKQHRINIEGICLNHLTSYIRILKITHILAIGRYTFTMITKAFPTMNTSYIPHPSPLNRNRHQCEEVLTEILKK